MINNPKALYQHSAEKGIPEFGDIPLFNDEEAVSKDVKVYIQMKIDNRYKIMPISSFCFDLQNYKIFNI